MQSIILIQVIPDTIIQINPEFFQQNQIIYIVFSQ